MYLLPPHCPPPTIDTPQQNGTFVKTDEPTPRPYFTSGLTLGGVHFMGLDKCVMTCIHHYDITQSTSTALKVLCALLIHPFLPSPHPLATTDGFTVSTVSPCLECRIVGIMQYSVCSDGLLLSSNMHLFSHCLFMI